MKYTNCIDAEREKTQNVIVTHRNLKCSNDNYFSCNSVCLITNLIHCNGFEIVKQIHLLLRQD